MKIFIIKVIRKTLKFIGVWPKVKPTELSGKSKLFEKEFHYHYHLAFQITYAEIFEKGIYTFNSTNPNPVIIDCGANMGLSLLFFSINYPNAKIYAFEPDVSVLEYLERNIKMQYGIQIIY
jgi:tRNA1(Val) A37 N6-methylase TrmN6